MNALTIAKGSLADVAAQTGRELAESFLNCDLIVVIDQSSSMGHRDAQGGLSRYDAAEREMARLQEANAGRVGVVEFADYARFRPGGIPSRMGGTTDMADALNFVLMADGVVDIVLISDGEPNSETAAFAAASKFRSPIHTIFIGPEHDHYGGREFLEALAARTGGTFDVKASADGMGQTVQYLLGGN